MAEGALEGLGSWLEASSGVVLGGFRGHSEAEEAVAVAGVGSLRS